VPLANWNGVESPLDEVKVSVLDRAFLFGDAVYEAMRVYGGRAWLQTEHMARLERSLREVRIPCDTHRLTERMLGTLRRSRVKEGLIYIQVTRGVAARRHAFQEKLVPNELLWVQDYGRDPYADVRPLGTIAVTQPDMRWARCDIKSVNLLANCLACKAADEAGGSEAVLINDAGIVTEATHSSVFGVKDGVIRTAPNGPHILPGITRDFVVNLARSLNLPIEETSLRREDLPSIEELFMSGTSIEIMPIVKLDGKPVGTGRCGPVALRLQQEYQAAIRNWLETSPVHGS
jgi:D-alanine transaminase